MQSLAEIVQETLEDKFFDPPRLQLVSWPRSDASFEEVAAAVAQLGDPFTHLRRPDEKNRFWVGVGIELELRILAQTGAGEDAITHHESPDGYPVVWRVMEGSPAAQAKLLPGDILLEADGVSLHSASYATCTQLFKGQEGSSIALTLRTRNGSHTRTVTVTRRRCKSDSVSARWLRRGLLVRGLGLSPYAYIEIRNFLSEEIFRSTFNIKEESQAARGTVIDLRGNHGGVHLWALHTASLFLPANSPLSYQPDAEAEGSYFLNISGETPGEINDRTVDSVNVLFSSTRALSQPLVVLVNSDTYSAAELFAAALQYNGALLVGEATGGKGLAQEILSIPTEQAVLTFSKFRLYTASGHWLGDGDKQRFGLQPDYPVRQEVLAPPGEAGDPQLQVAIRCLDERIISSYTGLRGRLKRNIARRLGLGH